VTLRNQIKRRTRHGRSFVDRRSGAGKNAIVIKAALLQDLGGETRGNTAQKILLELVCRDLYLLDQMDRRIQHVCKKIPAAKHNPAALAKLYAYR
jgi:hypothetical protein